jgi:hypothetical protein
MCFSALLSVDGLCKMNSSSPVSLSLRVLCCPILIATGFEKSVFRVLKKNFLFSIKNQVWYVVLKNEFWKILYFYAVNGKFVSFIIKADAINRYIHCFPELTHKHKLLTLKILC